MIRKSLIDVDNRIEIYKPYDSTLTLKSLLKDKKIAVIKKNYYYIIETIDSVNYKDIKQTLAMLKKDRTKKLNFFMTEIAKDIPTIIIY